MLQHLLRPFAYLRIEHHAKWQVDWLIPLLVATISTGAIAWMNHHGTVPILGDSGIVAKILGFVQNLPGFYIAALAAIATFNRTDIDRHMPEPTPSIDVVIQGKTILIKLTRRRFLCTMFAFLTAESILLTVIAILGLVTAEAAKSLIPYEFHSHAKYAFLFAYLTIFWQMIAASFWGLYYLGEKLHQPDQR
ncbi:hypothetical protein AO057_14720 [Curvibacter sp. PAE-UM]|nr:hypothetical protein AO057_14720 [Curvibacter sp. PAE-UM]